MMHLPTRATEFGRTLAVKALGAADEGRWDAFVESCPASTFFHRAGWRRVIEGSLGHDCHYLYVEAEGEIRGVLPLVHIRSRLFSNALISNAFCVYGGPATLDRDAYEALEGAAVDLARALAVDYLEFRSRARGSADWLCNEELYVTFRRRLDPDPEANLRAVPRKQRAMVRKGIKAALVGEVEPEIDRFYAIYSESVRNLGTPVLPKRYFAALKETFGEACDVLTVTSAGRALASVLSFYFRDEVHPYYGGGILAARASAANDFLYWELMRRACQRGYRVFDFGRSKRGTGSFAFKRHWGFEAEPLCYEFKLFRGSELPAYNPANPKYKAAIAVWRKLPLGVANLLGPVLARNLG
jgi:FemAB-related protein (PEP-CTERM system-associated)